MGQHLCVTIVPLFNHLLENEQNEINKLATHQKYKKGEIIFQPGDEALLIVASGSMKVYQLNSEGKEQLLRIITPGNYEGEKQLFGMKNESLFSEALEETVICRLTKQKFNQVIMDNPELGIKLFELSAQKMIQLEMQAQLLSAERVEARLATYLYNLSKNINSQNLYLPMKMKDLAQYLGTTPETLSRKFKFLEENAVIERKGRAITLLKGESLINI